MLYIARDKDYSLKLYTENPTKSESWWVGNSNGRIVILPEDLFINVKWSDEEAFVLSNEETEIVKNILLRNIECYANKINRNFKHLEFLCIDSKKYKKQFTENFNIKDEFSFLE